MRGNRGLRRWTTRAVLALLTAGLVGLMAAPGAQAAASPRSLTPFLSCYWDNGDGTISGVIGVTSSNGATVTVPVGPDNRITMGAPDRGQPTSFQSGSHNNVFVFTVTYAEIQAGINWQLTGNNVAVTTVDQCTSKPVPADGNALAVIAAGLLTTVVGGALLGGRRRLRRPGVAG